MIADCLKKNYLGGHNVYWKTVVKAAPQQSPSSNNCGLYVLLGMKNLIFMERYEESLILPRSKIRSKVGEDLIGNVLTF